MFHMGKIQDTKHFKYSAPFRPFLGKFGKDSAVDLYGRLHFYSAPLNLCGRRIVQLGTLIFGKYSEEQIVSTKAGKETVSQLVNKIVQHN
jgi:hypothetical protein